MAGKLVYQKWLMETWNKWIWWILVNIDFNSIINIWNLLLTCLPNLIIMPWRSIPVQAGQKFINQKLWLSMCVNIKGKTNSITKLYLTLLAYLLPFLSNYFLRFLEHPSLNHTNYIYHIVMGGKIKIEGILSFKVMDIRYRANSLLQKCHSW